MIFYNTFSVILPLVVSKCQTKATEHELNSGEGCLKFSTTLSAVFLFWKKNSRNRILSDPIFEKFFEPDV